MLFTKPNLDIHAIINQSGKHPELAVLHLAPDGTTVATDEVVMLAVSPADPETVFPDIGVESAAPGPLGASIRPEIVKQVVRNMPREVALQVADLIQCDDSGVEFATVDRQKVQKNSSLPIRSFFPDWRMLFARAVERVRSAGGGKAEVVLSRRRLLRLLKVMDDASGDRHDESPIYLTVSNDPKAPIIFRCRSYRTRQSILGLMLPLDASEASGELNRWERMLLGIKRMARLKAVRK